MNLIKIAIHSSQTISQAQIDARVGNIKTCGTGSRETKHFNWDRIKGAFQSCLDDAVEHYVGSGQVLHKEDRFAAPRPAIRHFIDNPRATVIAHPHDQRSLMWAAAQNLEFMRRGKRNANLVTAGALISFVNTGLDGVQEVTSWVCPMTYKHTALFVRVQKHDGPLSDVSRIQVARPATVVNSLNVFAGVHPTCQIKDIEVEVKPLAWIEYGGAARIAIAADTDIADADQLQLLGMTLSRDAPANGVKFRLTDDMPDKPVTDAAGDPIADAPFIEDMVMADDPEGPFSYDDAKMETSLESIGTHRTLYRLPKPKQYTQ